MNYSIRNYLRVAFLAIVLVLIVSDLSLAQKVNSSLGQNFTNPPLTGKPRALWTWVDGNFDKESITYELEEAKAKGMGGFDIWDVTHVQDEEKVVPPGKPFMGDEYTDAIVHAINEATRLDLELGIIVASGWNAGGAWTKPENATMGIYRSEKIVDGPKNSKIQLSFPEIPSKLGKKRMVDALIERDKDGVPVFYREVSVIAYPLTKDSIIADPKMVMDLTSLMDKMGNLNWDVPQGSWKIVRIVCANTGQPMIAHTPSSKGPMIDHFNPEATAIHIQYFVDKLLAKLGTFKGKALKYFYSDSYEVTGELWTPKMLEAFQKQFGYSMQPFLPVFQGFTVINKDATRRFLYDYRQLLSDLIITSHYKKAREVCEKYGLGYVAEAAGPGKPLHNCPFESLKSSGVLTHPRGEFWHKSPSPYKDSLYDILQVIKGVSSASHIYNQRIVDAEAFTSVWLWQESLDELKPTADKAFCEGLNRIVFHTFPHVPKSAGKPGWIYGFGTQISVTQPWWPLAKPFMDYLGRCGYMLQQGNFVGDVLYYYGDEAPNFVPNKIIHPSLGFGYDYDVTNSDVILNRLTTKDGKLTLPHGQQYQVLVLPNLDEMNIDVLNKIEKLVALGATVIGPKPTKSTGYKNYQENDEKVMKLANRMWGACDGKTVKETSYGKGRIVWGKDIRTVLMEQGSMPDFSAENVAKLDEVDYIHRKTVNEDIYFVCNRKKSPQTLNASFRVTGKKAQLWDPVTGLRSVIDIKEVGSISQVNIELEAYGSAFIVFTNTIEEPMAKWIVNPATKAESTDSLTGSWNLTFPNGSGAPAKAQLPKLIDLSTSTIDGIKFFSGIVNYETSYTVPYAINLSTYSVFIDLGEVGVVAGVTVNGQNLGTRWKSPFVIDTKNTLKPGQNILQIEVGNRWVNRLVGDALLPKEKRFTNTNITKLPNGWMIPMSKIPNEKYGIPPSGLLGPVKFYYVKN